MKPTTEELTALINQAVLGLFVEWELAGSDLVSILANGQAYPWPAAPVDQILAQAKEIDLEVLSLKDPEHVVRIVEAVLATMTKSFEATLTRCHASKFSPWVAEGGQA